MLSLNRKCLQELTNIVRLSMFYGLEEAEAILSSLACLVDVFLGYTAVRQVINHPTGLLWAESVVTRYGRLYTGRRCCRFILLRTRS